MADFFAFYPPGSGGGTNASVGPNGSTAPTSSTEVGGIDPSGDLHPLQTDADGNLLISLADAPILPFDVNLTEVNGAAISEGQKTMAESLPVVLSSDQSAIPVSQSGTWNINNISGTISLPTGAATSALQTTGNASLSTIESNTNELADCIVPINTASPPNTLSIGVINASGDLEALPFGQGPMTASLPIVIASDQSAVDVNIQGTVPISGTIAATQSGTWNINDISGTISLPTGAATSANQTTANSSLSTIASNTGNIPTVGQKAMSGSTPVAIASDQSAIPVNATPVGTIIGNSPIENDYTSTSITTSAYTQLVASTSSNINCIHIFDSSGQAMIFAIGGSGSEVDQLYVPPGGDTYSFHIPSGTRISYKALTANATAGYLLMSFLG